MFETNRKYYVYEHYTADSKELFYVGVAKSHKRVTSALSGTLLVKLFK